MLILSSFVRWLIICSLCGTKVHAEIIVVRFMRNQHGLLIHYVI